MFHPILRRLCALMVVGGVSAHAHALTIDGFDASLLIESLETAIADTAVVKNSSVAGGVRTLYVRKTAGTAGARLQTLGGALYLSQDSGVAAQSVITWDGDTKPATVDFDGLGGVDLTQDGATGILIHLLSNDAAFELAIKVYDVSDPSGERYSLGRKIVPGAAGDQWILLPFTDLVEHGFVGPANVRSVGAVQLLINGSSLGLDAAIDWIGTDGKCSDVAVAGKQIYFDISSDLVALRSRLKLQFDHVQTHLGSIAKTNSSLARSARRKANAYNVRAAAAIDQIQPQLLTCTQSLTCVRSRVNASLIKSSRGNLTNLYNLNMSLLKTLHRSPNRTLLQKQKIARGHLTAQNAFLKKIPATTLSCP